MVAVLRLFFPLSFALASMSVVVSVHVVRKHNTKVQAKMSLAAVTATIMLLMQLY